jgi:RNase P/RNase MRP subunit p29
MSRSLTAAFVTAVLVVPALSSAQSLQPKAPFEHVTPGLSVSVVDDAGRRVEGRVVDVTDETVRVSVRKAIEHIPIDRVVRIEKADSLRNGALSGLVAGVGFGLMVSLSGSDLHGRWVASAVISNGLIWSAFGAGIDALVDSRRTLYQRSPGGLQSRVTPIVGPGVRGAAMRVSW